MLEACAFRELLRAYVLGFATPVVMVGVGLLLGVFAEYLGKRWRG